MKKKNILVQTIIISMLLYITGCSSTTRLFNASYNGKYTTIKELIDEGVDVNITDKYGWTPLMWSTYYGYYDIAAYLLENGANPHLQTQKDYSSFKKGTTVLMIAAYYGHIPIIRELHKYKVDPYMKDSAGNTAVIYAEQYHGIDIGKLVKGDYN